MPYSKEEHMFSIERLIYGVPAILIALTFHEAAHGLVAFLLGDNTAKRQGRLTLNPLPHLDPTGALLLLITGFGWAKPVPVNPYNFRGNRQSGMVLVSLAGPLSNLLIALVGAILYNLFNQLAYLNKFLEQLVIINVILAIFNLIPIPPLDGSKILMGLTPKQGLDFYSKLEAYGPAILILLIVTGVTEKIMQYFFSPVIYVISYLSSLIIR
jgi:Zn-dependent protease